MPNHLPDYLGNSSPTPLSQVRGSVTLRRSGTIAYRHAVRTSLGAEIERIDAMAAADAAKFSLGEELNVLAYGKTRAGDDPDAQALVRRKVAGLADRNDRRLDRRYG